MARRSTSISVSLFPFLAVLLCAMGALIVLLVILTEQVRENVFAGVTARQMQPDRAESSGVAGSDPAFPQAVAPEVVTIMRPARPAGPPPVNPNTMLRKDLEEVQSRVHAVEPKVRAIREAFEAARELEARNDQEHQSVQLRRDADAQRLKARESELDEHHERLRAYEQRLAAAREALEVTASQAATASAKVQIVPYDGRLGTARRPILIECTAEHIRFVPEDVALTPSELEGFRVGFNPLLAGTAALRNYWKIQDGSETAPPYVLLVVHEDGIIAYYAARSLLASLDAEMGYELITNEQKLAYPPVDPVAREICQNAVQEVLALRSASGPVIAGDGKNFPNGRFDVDPGEHDPTRREPMHSFELPKRGTAGTGPNTGGGNPLRSSEDRTDLPPELSPGLPPLPGGPSKDPISLGEMESGIHGRPELPGEFSGELPREAELPALPRGDVGGETQLLTPPDARPLVSAPSLGESSDRGESMGGGQLPVNDRTPVATRNPAPPRLTQRGKNEGSGNSPTESSFLDRLRHRRQDGSKRPLKWGESSPHAMISLERSVRVTISESFVQVGNQPARLVGPQGITGDVIEDVFLGIESEARSWGTAPESFYWMPHIKVFIQPGGEHSFTRLKSAFQKAGLPVTDQLELGHHQAAVRGVEHVTPTP